MGKNEDNLLKAVRNWVRKIYLTDKHLIKTEYWLKKLEPDADLAMVIAAITHDIERAFPENRKAPIPETGGVKWSDEAYNLWHGKRSAEFAARFLKKIGADPILIKKVKFLVTYHEIGGDKERDLIKDADSISVLENNVPFFLSWIPERDTKSGIREKFDYMFNRISSKRAKALAKPFYKKAIRQLESL